MRDNFSYFSLKVYVVTPHRNRLVETVPMKGHNICLYAELIKLSLIIIKYSFLFRALEGSQVQLLFFFQK